MKNNLIFTTQGRYSNKPIIFEFAIVAILGVCFMLIFPNALDSLIGWAISAVFIILVCIPVRRHLQIKKSYINIYNDHIEGLAVPEKCFTINDASTKFFVVYKDITHTDSQQNIVKIYTVNGCYLVQAVQCEQQVIDIIKQQKELDIQQ